MVIIVFDFDDTIFATSHFYGKEPVLCPELAESIEKLLQLAKQLGKVYIITNAEREWIKFCLKHQIPHCETLKKIVESEDHVFSSMDKGISKYAEISAWKCHAFHQKFSDFQDGHPRQLICFGDSPFDRLAALSIKDNYKNIIVKNVMMKIRPTLEELILQHKIIHSRLQYIVEHFGHLDLTLMTDCPYL